MKRRYPLYAKILLWFFLNLLLLVAAVYLVVRIQFRFGLDMLIAGRGGERIQGLANVLSAELDERPREEWDAMLKRFAGGYGVKLALFRPDGGFVAGDQFIVPRPVADRLRERPIIPGTGERPPLPAPGTPFSDPARFQGDTERRPATRPEQNFPPGPNLRPGDEPGDSRSPLRPPQFRAGPGASVLGEPPAEPLRNSPPAGRPRFMLRTSDPARYWVGVQLPAHESGRPQPRLTLLAMSGSLRGGGLFFDYTPWLFVAGGVVIFSVLFWLPFVRGITRTISQMTRATEEIAEGRFNGRVAEHRRDELGSLAVAINRMAARLAGFVTGQKRFLGDTAHELCAPIARMQMALGILEQRADEKQKPYVNDAREELQQISGLVNELLSFSKAGLRQQALKLVPVHLATVARRVVEREEKTGGKIEIRIDENLFALGEAELLSRALANLIRNAMRYAGSGGDIVIAAQRDGERVIMVVADEGPGVPEESLPKIFDTFFRVEASRSRETGGMGLGLAIVKTCVEACEGSVTAQNREPRGLEIKIMLRAAIV